MLIGGDAYRPLTGGLAVMEDGTATWPLAGPCAAGPCAAGPGAAGPCAAAAAQVAAEVRGAVRASNVNDCNATRRIDGQARAAARSNSHTSDRERSLREGDAELTTRIVRFICSLVQQDMCALLPLAVAILTAV